MQSNIKSFLDARYEAKQKAKDEKVFNTIVGVVVALPVVFMLLANFY